ncbi:hypothetical protein [Nocardia huaxiensis]|uniref:Uncharacterized protein n=1 Tax=Nocardia huaxiensis TaxID=2755382 RepID=A0A7D6Z1N0_9NOCA|nr:hypothetical protein [Nocardia huaxiensis]QLY28444.1 hypothetical protein H0264_24105 [Nocardia huaxiensis]UFS98106.1 hypothetical protein LPY97_09500 [Nocardia huaxiensis]
MSEIERLSALSGVARGELEALGELDEDQYRVLRQAFERAQETRQRELDEAIDGGLTMVPRLVRPAVRRMLFS